MLFMLYLVKENGYRGVSTSKRTFITQLSGHAMCFTNANNRGTRAARSKLEIIRLRMHPLFCCLMQTLGLSEKRAVQYTSC